VEVSREALFSPLVPTLVDLTKEAQMIVVGCRGQGALARGLLGSVSPRWSTRIALSPVINHAEVPSSQAPVLVGIDGSSASELAMSIAIDEASWRGGRVPEAV
jgi:nucleotide-binding universal stress UspA family protein